MTTITDFELVLATENNQHRLEVWEDSGHQLKVLILDADSGEIIAGQTFRYCETQHHDSERWLNDQIGYPNDFAGILSSQIWYHL